MVLSLKGHKLVYCGCVGHDIYLPCGCIVGRDVSEMNREQSWLWVVSIVVVFHFLRCCWVDVEMLLESHCLRFFKTFEGRTFCS